VVASGLSASAVRELCSVIGDEHVAGGARELREVATATFETRQAVRLIIRPANRQEVQECMRIANKHRIPIYPVSSGKNWGYGSSVPASDANVVMDLGRLNEIVDFSEDLAYVTVGPGVTQRQLQDFLREKQSKLWMDATGASPECSLIGNAVERGFGHTPYGDHFAQVCGMEVVLPTGECIETGFSRFPGAATGPLYRWGVGPSVDGIFSQSNFGVVTKMTVWLMPAPEYFEAFFFRCDDERGLSDVINGLRPLRLTGTLRSTVHIGNDYKVLNGIQQYPWEATSGQTPLSAQVMKQFRKEKQFGVWNGSGGLYGTKAQVAEARRLISRQLKGKVARLQFLNDRKLELASKFAGVYRFFTGWDLRAALQLVRPVYGLLKGLPTNKPLATAYWRKRTSAPPDANPDRDGCGLLWCAPVAPLDGAHAQRLSDIICDIVLAHGFEPMISLSLVTERALTAVVSICYDREVAGEDARAMICYRELLSRLNAAGYYSYRLGIQSMDEMSSSASHSAFLHSLKAALDPNNILAPGRYQPAATGNGANGHAVREDLYVAGN